MFTMIAQLILPLSVVKAHTDAGDVNKDGVLNNADIMQLRTAVLSNTDLGGTPKLGDINEDGLVDITDLMLLRRAIVDEVKVGTDRSNLQIGDYINYTPDTATAYSKDKLAESITGTNDNPEDIIQENLKWQILRKYDDGSMDLIGSSTLQNLALKGAVGYCNGVYLMNDICKSLYSKTSEGIEARSVNINDYEYYLTDAGKADKVSASLTNLRTYGDLVQVNARVPDIFLKTDNESDSYYSNPLTQSIETNLGSFNGNIKCTFYVIDISEVHYGKGYKALITSNANVGGRSWIATRCETGNANNNSVIAFCLFKCNYNNYTEYSVMCNTDSANFSRDLCCLRPVVKLPADAKITVSSTASTETGTPHTITKY